MPLPPETLAANVSAVAARIQLACERSGRDPRSVNLVAVSKSQPAEAVRVAVTCGLGDFGENRVQEALAKQDALSGTPVNWHLIGHLQTNKVRATSGRFAILHAIDSARVLAPVAAGAANGCQRVMIEVNVSGEATKFGVSPGELGELVRFARSLPAVRLEGLMTVAPQSTNPQDARSHFARLRELARIFDLPHLSMGMTDDFEVAIEEGATFIRVGRAIFGERS